MLARRGSTQATGPYSLWRRFWGGDRPPKAAAQRSRHVYGREHLKRLLRPCRVAPYGRPGRDHPKGSSACVNLGPSVGRGPLPP